MSRIEAVATHRIEAPAERAFDAWVNPDKIRLWMTSGLRSMGLAGDIRHVETDPHLGGRFFFSDQRGDVEAKHWGTYLDFDSPHKLVFTWITEESEEADPSVVTVTFEPAGAGTDVKIVHEMDEAWADYVPQVVKGWTQFLVDMSTNVV